MYLVYSILLKMSNTSFLFTNLIKKNKIGELKSLLEMKVSPNKIENGLSPLVIAIEFNSFDSVKLLVKHGADLQPETREFENKPLAIAIKYSALHIAEFIFRSIQANTPTADLSSYLNYALAIYRKYIPRNYNFKSLLADMRRQYDKDVKFKIIKLLMIANVNLNFKEYHYCFAGLCIQNRDYSVRTFYPIEYAITTRDVRVVRLLLKNGADPSVKDKIMIKKIREVRYMSLDNRFKPYKNQGHSILIDALKIDGKIFKLLIDSECFSEKDLLIFLEYLITTTTCIDDYYRKFDEWEYPNLSAINEDVISALLSKIKTFDSYYDKIMTSIINHCSTNEGDDILEYILPNIEMTAKLHHLVNEVNFCYSYISGLSHEELLKKNHSGRLTEIGNKLVHDAVKYGDVDMLEKLILLKCNLINSNKDGMTPLLIANIEKNYKCAEMLRQNIKVEDNVVVAELVQ